jgi:phospholipid N-methyltransferase
MFAGLDIGDGDTVLELGPGTGAFTAEVAALARSGASIHYLGIERDEEMYHYLCRTYPELDFVLGDVLDIEEICARHGVAEAEIILCGVPLILMPSETMRSVIDGVRSCLAPGGTFRTFSYVHCALTKRARRLRAQMAEFGSASVVPVSRNLPPALVLTAAHSTGIASRGVSGYPPPAALPEPSSSTSSALSRGASQVSLAPAGQRTSMSSID